MQLQKYIYTVLFLFPLISSAQKNDSLGNFGRASFYHDSFNGLETSNGETYDKDDFTAAHRTYPFNSILLVTNKVNNKSVVVRVNDRGPFVHSRVIDLSSAAAKKIGMVPFGVVPVKIKVLNFLNPRLMNDTLLKDGEIWDCYGKRRKLSDTVIFIWRTDSWKHAFYMASCLSLEYKLNSIVVKVSGSSDKRSYALFVSDISDKNELNKLATVFRSDGFYHTNIIHTLPTKAKQHAGQSPK